MAIQIRSNQIANLQITTALIDNAAVSNDKLAGAIADSKLNTITSANKVSGSAIQLGASSGLQDSSGLKIAAGGGMIALGVAAGAAGAAISVPGGGGAPASPRASRDAGGGGEKTIVLNMNGPLLTAQTEAGVGRSVTRSHRQAERVYGSAAA